MAYMMENEIGMLHTNNDSDSDGMDGKPNKNISNLYKDGRGRRPDSPTPKQK